MKLCINSRDELLIVLINKIACIQADGNQTSITYISGQKINISFGISKLEDMIKSLYTKGESSPFVRLGRSCIINQSFLCHISVLRQKLVLSDGDKHSIAVSAPKAILKQYKDYIKSQYEQSLQPDNTNS